MLATLNEVLKTAEKNNYAIGAFNTPNFECLLAVIRNAEEMNVPIIISHAELHEEAAPLKDIGKAMLYIREHADEWRVDVDRIALCGFSAGAHNCAMYSVYYDQPVITDYLGIAEGIKPVGAVLGYMLSDYCALAVSEKAEDPLFQMSMKAFTGEEMVDSNTLKDFSPSRLVSQDTPPMFLWATDDDQMVESKHSLLMACALAEKKVPYELHIFEDGN